MSLEEKAQQKKMYDKIQIETNVSNVRYLPN